MNSFDYPSIKLNESTVQLIVDSIEYDKNNF